MFRRMLAGSVAAALAVTLSAVTTSTPTAAAPHGTSKIEAAVLEPGTTTFWVALETQAELASAASAEAVYEAKTAHADRAQAGLRSFLARRGAEFEPFWLDNSIKVTGDAALAAELAKRPEVAAIEADEAIPAPVVKTATTGVAMADWNLHAIGATRVWDELGVRGEGIVVASIDTGVDYDHPGLIGSYRGTAPDGTVSHDYNWYDPAGQCPDGTPCDGSNHGTHVMGTMVGRDRVLEFGVAPGAKWISAKACTRRVCERGDLLAAGQWILAPTDRNGQNPRPDLAPDIVNNSWGGPPADQWYAETVRSWVAAGIFPAFAAGNSGPGCGTADEPGNDDSAYATGAFDSSGTIAAFSARGPGNGAATKPDLAAPGDWIRSSVPGGGYNYGSGTSMASPHTAGTVALMWSHSPGIHGDIAATRDALDGSATDVEDLTCGGTVDDNNVYGEGRLNAYAAVTANPRGSIGALGGTVTVDGTGRGAVEVTVDGPQTRRVATDPAGRYALPRLLAGEYTVRAELFGYLPATGTVTVTEDGTATSDHTLTPAPHGTVAGTVRTSSGPLAAAKVTAAGTPTTAMTGADGSYTLRLPLGEYDLRAENTTSRCTTPTAEPVTVGGDATLDLLLDDRVDGFGYRCAEAAAGWVSGTERLNIDWPADVNGHRDEVQLPFPFTLYGRTYRTANVYSFGFVGFGDPLSSSQARRPTTLPAATAPNAGLYALWDVWGVDERGGIYTAVTGTAPNRTFVVEWRDLYRFSPDDGRVSFAALLGEDGSVSYRYRGARFDDESNAGGTGAIGLENADGTVGFQYGAFEAVVRDGLAVSFRPGDTGMARGAVTDANDGLPVAGATATLSGDGSAIATDVTAADGGYAFQVEPGDYQMTVTRDGYEAAGTAYSVSAGAPADRALALRTARVTAPQRVERVVPAGEVRQHTFELANTGELGTGYTVSERTDVGWLTVVDGAGALGPGARATVTVTVDAARLPAGTSHEAELVVSSASGRAPEVAVPVTLVVPRHRIAVDAGAHRGLVDSLGDAWEADQQYHPGSYGYVDRSRTRSTDASIAGTGDPARFRTLREGMHGYRFDGLTPGVYTVELDFAELTGAEPTERLFDVIVQRGTATAALDVADQVGDHTALSLKFTAQVSGDGSLDVEFGGNEAYDPAIVNAIRITHRPDLS